jgi:DNA helicase-2/ATP-dependent DNA helicase PcrA
VINKKAKGKNKTEMVYAAEDNPLLDKFKTSKHKLVRPKYNSKLQSLINLELNPIGYGTDSTRFVKALQSKTYCQYQSELLHSYLEEPAANGLKLDCDRLTLTMKCNKGDVNKLIDKEKGFKHLRIECMAPVLVFVKAYASQPNSGGGKGENRPHYNKAFAIHVGGNSRKFFNLQIATGKTPNGKKNIKRSRRSIRIDFIPDRFSEFELNLLFGHLKSVLKAKSYNSLMQKAVVTRVDIGLVMPGILSTFVYASLTDNKVVDGSCKPDEEPDSLVETMYLGNKSKSNHFIIYDKLLKEMKESSALLASFKQLAVTTRFEYRYYSYRDEVILLPDLDSTPLKLDQLEVLDPLLLQHQERTLLAKMLRNKKPVFMELKKEAITREAADIGSSKPDISLDSQWLAKAQHNMLANYRGIILSPNKITKKEINTLLTKAPKAVNEDASTVPQKVSKQKRPETDYQKLAVEAAERNVLVVAGAGTGKTKVIVDRVQNMFDNDYNASRMRVLTFTNAAAFEVGKRITAQIHCRDVISSTFSSWCKELLENYTDNKYRGYQVFDTSDGDEQEDKEETLEKSTKLLQEDVLAEIFEQLGLSKVFSTTDFIKVLSYRRNKRVSMKRSLVINLPDLLKQLDSFIKIEKRYNKKKKELKRWDFDDLLVFVLRHLKENVGGFKRKVSDSFKYLLIDEMQDTAVVQWRIIELLVNQGTHIYCVGDPAQSIYGFRGADWTLLDDFENMFPNAATYPLIQHYRSTPEILTVTNWFREKINKEYKALVTDLPSGSKPLVEELDDTNDVGHWIAKDIKRKLKKGTKAKEILVVAKHTKEVEALQQILKSASISIEEYKKDDEFDNKCKHKIKIGVRVTTMHKAKGAERDVCYVVDPRFSINFNQDVEADYLRLMYVAVTRARHKLIICKSKCGDSNYKEEEGLKSTKQNILDELQYVPELFD